MGTYGNVSNPPVPAVKPGWQTTEFWVTVITLGMGILLTTGVVSPASYAQVTNPAELNELAGILTMVAPVVVYAISRAWVKVNADLVPAKASPTTPPAVAPPTPAPSPATPTPTTAKLGAEEKRVAARPARPTAIRRPAKSVKAKTATKEGLVF